MKLNIRALFPFLFTLSAVLCSCSTSLRHADDDFSRRLIGRWMLDGNHWEFRQNNSGTFWTYEGHSHFPVEGEFMWYVDSHTLTVKFSRESPWRDEQRQYILEDATARHLVMHSIASKERMQLVRDDDE